MQNNSDCHRVIFERNPVLHKPHSYSSFKAGVGRRSGSRGVTSVPLVLHGMTSGSIQTDLSLFF